MADKATNAAPSASVDITVDDILSWADGIYSDLGTEYAGRVTDLEARIARAINNEIKHID